MWLVRGLIWAFGFFVVYLVLGFFRKKDGGGASEPDAIDGLLAQARKRLASAGVAVRAAPFTERLGISPRWMARMARAVSLLAFSNAFWLAERSFGKAT